MDKLYYLGHSYMGINYTYDSPCWEVYGFGSKKERDAGVESNPTQNRAITRPVAYKILGMGKNYRVLNDPDGRLFKYPRNSI